MSLRVGQRVTTIDGHRGKIKGTETGGIEDIFWVTDKPRPYFAWQLTPEPDCSWVDRMLLITYPGLYICERAGECREKGVDCPGHQTPHAKKWDCTRPCFDHARCIPYVPELFICEKAGECKHTGCFSARPHEWRSGCEAMCSKGATCIPYVPEDEGREWLVVDELGLQATRLTKDAASRLAAKCYGRAFKWSDGLKGGE